MRRIERGARPQIIAGGMDIVQHSSIEIARITLFAFLHEFRETGLPEQLTQGSKRAALRAIGNYIHGNPSRVLRYSEMINLTKMIEVTPDQGGNREQYTSNGIEALAGLCFFIDQKGLFGSGVIDWQNIVPEYKQVLNDHPVADAFWDQNYTVYLARNRKVHKFSRRRDKI